MTFANTLIERLKKGPFTAELNFGYYTEDMKITLLDEGQLKVELEVPCYTEYENGTHTYEEIVSVQAFEEFLSNRLAEDMTKLSINGTKVKGVNLVADFARSLRFEAHEAESKIAEDILYEAAQLADKDFDEACEHEDENAMHYFDVHLALEEMSNEAGMGRISGNEPSQLLARAMEFMPKHLKEEVTAEEVLSYITKAIKKLEK